MYRSGEVEQRVSRVAFLPLGESALAGGYFRHECQVFVRQAHNFDQTAKAASREQFFDQIAIA